MGGSYNNTSAFSGGSQAFLFSGGSLQDVGVLPGQPASVATAINNLGQIVGYGNTGGAAPHAFLFSGGSMQNLAAGEADAINNLGQVVGEALIGSSAYHAFLYSGGTLQDLNNLIPSNSGWTLTEATGMNDSGQICGYGFNPSGQSRAFLLTRISALTEQWAVNGSGSWSAPGNWTDPSVPGGAAVPGAATTASLALGVPGGIAQDAALFGTALKSGTATVTLDASRSLSGLGFGTTGGASYVISPSGASTLTLSNTSGSVTISDSGGNHTINAPITLGSNLSISATTGSSLTIAGAMSGGTNTLSLSGGGELVLSGANTYTGATTIGAGTLQIGNGGVTGALSTSSSIADNGTLVFDRSNTVTQGTDFSAAGIAGTGSLTQAGSGLLVLNASNTYTGTTTIIAGTLQIGSGGTAGSIVANIVDNGALVFDRSNNLTFAGVISGSGSLTQAGSGILALGAANTYTGITLVSGGTLLLANSGALSDSTVDTSGAGSLSFGTLTAATFGGLQGSGNLPLINATSAVALSVGGNNASATYTGVISGPGSLTKNGSGSFTLAAANTYPGTTTISAGTLVLANSNALQDSTATVNTVMNGLAFAPGIGTFNLGGLEGPGNIVLADLSGAAVTLQVGGSASTTYSGSLSGAGSLTQLGPGTLDLTGSNTYGGGTTILAGTLQVGNGGAAGSLSISSSIIDNGALVFNRNNTVTQGTDFSTAGIGGTGSLTQAGAGLLVLNAANTFTGTTTISAGTLQVGNGGTTGSIAGNIVDNGVLVFDRSDNLTFGSAISGSGNVTQMGPGTLILTASSSYSGTTTISAGTLQIDNGGTSGSITGNVVNNAVLAFDRADNYTFPGNITGSGSVIMNGLGTLVLTGTVSSGNITVNQGQIVAGPGSVNVTGNLTILAGQRFTCSGSNLSVINLSNSGTFIGGGTVTGNFLNPSSGDVRIGPAQTLLLQNSETNSNAGTIEVLGSGASPAEFESAAPLINTGTIAAQNATFHFDGGLTNQATVAFTGGISNVFGQVTNNAGATISLTGGAGVTFYNDVIQNGTFDVSTVGGTSSAVFLGAVSGSGAITGGGEVLFVGDPVLSGNHTISAAMLLGANLEVTASAGQTLQLSGDVSGNAGSLTLSGDGRLILSGSNSYGGGTTVTAGTLYVTDSEGLCSGTSLTVGAGATSIFDSSAAGVAVAASAGAVTVPEPGTLALLGAGAIGLLACTWRRRRSAKMAPIATCPPM